MYSEAPFSNPWAGAIAETIGAPARARAAALRAAGQAQAHATEVSGQAYGSALQNIGQTVAAIPAQMQQQKLQQQESQVRELQIAAAKRQQAGQLVLAQAIKRFSDPQTGKVDHQAIANFVSQNGFPDQGEAWLKMASSNAESLDKLTESTRNHAKQGLETLGDLAFQANSPQEFTAAVGLAATVGLIDEQTAHSIAAQAGNGDAWQATKQKYESYSPRYQAQQAKLREPVKIGEAEKIIIPATGATVAEGAPKSSSEKDDQRYRAIQASILQKQTVPPADLAWAAGYEKQKTLGPEASAAAAADRQAATISQQNGIQQRNQDFQIAQAGRKELTDKIEQPYQTAIGSANTLRDVVAAAQAGNKVAGSLQSLETTMSAIRAQGLNRINTAEIGVTADSGSLWDRLVGWVGKAESGQPVPANIQKDMIAFADILEKAAYKKYTEGFASTTKRYRLTDEKPLPAPGMIRARDPQGVLHEAAPGTPLPAGWRLEQ